MSDSFDFPARVDELEALRARLHEELAGLGDFRPGSIGVNFRRCGRPRCACAGPGHPGHGPQVLLVCRQGGRRVARSLRPGPERARIEAEIGRYRRFRALIARLIETNRRLCDARHPRIDKTRPDPVESRSPRGQARAPETPGARPRADPYKRSRPR